MDKSMAAIQAVFAPVEKLLSKFSNKIVLLTNYLTFLSYAVYYNALSGDKLSVESAQLLSLGQESPDRRSEEVA